MRGGLITTISPRCFPPCALGARATFALRCLALASPPSLTGGTKSLARPEIGQPTAIGKGAALPVTSVPAGRGRGRSQGGKVRGNKAQGWKGQPPQEEGSRGREPVKGKGKKERLQKPQLKPALLGQSKH